MLLQNDGFGSTDYPGAPENRRAQATCPHPEQADWVSGASSAMSGAEAWIGSSVRDALQSLQQQQGSQAFEGSSAGLPSLGEKLLSGLMNINSSPTRSDPGNRRKHRTTMKWPAAHLVREGLMRFALAHNPST